MKAAITLLIFLICVVKAASAGFDEAKVAMERGDFATALEKLRPLALGGNTLAQTVMGQIYATGEGVTRDYVSAAKWYRMAAERGSSVGQSRLAGMYRSGKGVQQDLKEAAKWYTRAAEQGETEAMISLGLMFQHGDGVPKDHVKAEKWYRNALVQGYKWIKMPSANLSIETPGIRFDTAMATQALGSMYERGHGPPLDLAKAFKWYSIGMELTASPMNKTLLELLSKKMTAEQIAEGKRAAKEWLAAAEQSDKR